MCSDKKIILRYHWSDIVQWDSTLVSVVQPYKANCMEQKYIIKNIYALSMVCGSIVIDSN